MSSRLFTHTYRPRRARCWSSSSCRCTASPLPDRFHVQNLLRATSAETRAADNVLRSRDASCRPTPVENVPLDPVPSVDGPWPQDLQVSRGQGLPPHRRSQQFSFRSSSHPAAHPSGRIGPRRAAHLTLAPILPHQLVTTDRGLISGGEIRGLIMPVVLRKAKCCPTSRFSHAKSELLRCRRGAPRSEFSRK